MQQDVCLGNHFALKYTNIVDELRLFLLQQTKNIAL